MSTRLLLSALFTLASVASMSAQQMPPMAAAPSAAVTAPAKDTATAAPAATAPVEAPKPASTVQGAEPVKGTASRDHDTLSVDFPDEDIKSILRNVADLFELNLVVPDTLTGKTSIKLRDVSWRQIFQVVLAPVNFTYVEEGNIIKIISNESLLDEPMATDVIILNSAKAGEIKPTIDGLIDAAKGGKILIDARSNALVITERPSRMSRIRSTIDKLDKPTGQVMIESKFVEVLDRDVKDIGLDWTLTGGGTARQNYDYLKDHGNVVTNSNNSGGPDVVRNASSSTVVDSSISNPPVVGANPPTTTVTLNSNNGLSTTFNSNALNNTTYDLAKGLQTAVLSNYRFGVVLKALQTNNKSKIVSNPTVVTMNNSEAIINVGSEDPVPRFTYNQQQGTYEVSGFDLMKIGIILKVTPQISGNGVINMKLAPEVSQKTGSVQFGSAQIPIKATRSVTTQVSLRDGYTMGIGGLMTTNREQGGTKLPFLGSIPGLGKLFSSKSNNVSTTTLLVFVTAKIINAEGGSPEEIFDPRTIKAMGITRDELPGNRAPKGTDIFSAPAPEKKE